MALHKRWLWLAFVILLAILGWFGYCKFWGSSPAPMTNAGPTVGVVDLQQAVKVHPSYQEYAKLKKELDLMTLSFEEKEEGFRMQLAEEALTSESHAKEALMAREQGIVNSLNAELQAKLKAKEDELNAKLQAKQKELFQKYEAELKVQPSDADLRIVNLQLGLAGKTHGLILNEEQKAAAIAEKEAREEELKTLLQNRNNSGMSEAGKALEQKVMAELAPMMEAGQKELNAYGESLMKELGERRDALMVQEMQHFQPQGPAMGTVDEFNALSDEWSERLAMQEDSVKALHDAILEDIRTRVAVIAQEKKLDVVVTDQVSNIQGIDITDALIASYLK